MLLPTLLTLMVTDARAEAPHAAAVQILAPADHTVLTDWSAPVEVTGGLNVKPETYGWYQCVYLVDGIVRYSGAFETNGRCRGMLDLSALVAGRHKVTFKAASEGLARSYEVSIGLLLNGTPQVTAEVEGSCVPDAASPEFVFDVEVDDAFWAPPDDREIVLPLDVLSHRETLMVTAELYAEDGTRVGYESAEVATDSDGHYTGPISVVPLATSVGPYSWRITATDPPGASGTYPADGTSTGSLLIDAPPAATWYDTVAGAGDDPSTGLAWSNDVAHSPYMVEVHLEDDDSALADIDTILLTAATTGAETQLHCFDVYGVQQQYCSGGGGDWLLALPTADLSFETYDVSLLMMDTCAATDSLTLTVAPDDDVDNDRDGTTENGVGAAHDCDDDDRDNLGGADAVDAVGGNEADVDAAPMAGDTSAGFSAEGNLHNAGDVDWWAFEVSGDGTRFGENASFVVELVVPADGAVPDGVWAVSVETNVDGSTTPDDDPSRIAELSIGAVSQDCSAGTSCTLVLEVAGREGTPGELYWWIGISAPFWSAAMCDDAGGAYAVQVRE